MFGKISALLIISVSAFCQETRSSIAGRVSELVQLPMQPICEAFDRCQRAVLSKELTLFTTPAINDWSILTLKEQVELRRFLRAQEHFLGHEERVSGLLVTTLANVFAGISSLIPRHDGRAQFTVPLYTLIDAYKEFERRVGQTASPRGSKTELILDAIDQRDGPFQAADLQRDCPGVGVDLLPELAVEAQ